jgi:hypothetical protein
LSHGNRQAFRPIGGADNPSSRFCLSIHGKVVPYK